MTRTVLIIMHTIRTLLVLIAVVATVFAAGCRQADGTVPAPAGEQQNKIDDIGRNLQNMAGQQAGADADLIEDIENIDAGVRPRPLVEDLVRALDVALGGKDVDDEGARKLASVLFVVATARELSGRQIEQLGTDVEQAVAEVGADPAAAARVGTAASALATARTQNARRWYHLF